MFAVNVTGCARGFDACGTVISFALGIAPEDFDIIPTNQDLYCVVQTSPSQIVKVSHTLFTNYWGDLLITQAGDGETLPDGKLFIVHWDSTNATFVTRSFSKCGDWFEHVTFAPIDLFSTTLVPCPP